MGGIEALSKQLWTAVRKGTLIPYLRCLAVGRGGSIIRIHPHPGLDSNVDSSTPANTLTMSNENGSTAIDRGQEQPESAMVAETTYLLQAHAASEDDVRERTAASSPPATATETGDIPVAAEGPVDEYHMLLFPPTGDRNMLDSASLQQLSLCWL